MSNFDNSIRGFGNDLANPYPFNGGIVTRKLFGLACLLALCLGLLSSTQARAADSKPNFIVFLADDLGWGELGCQGFTKEVPTPNIDSIAQHGIRFTDGYIAATYCSPSRAGLMTGRYPTRFGHEFNGGGPNFGLPLTETTVANHMKDLGYATCAIGKWHLGDQPNNEPTKRGYDEYMGCLANPGSYFEPRQWRDSLNKVTPGKGFYTTDAFADRGVDWIERNKSHPFFLYMPFNGVHAPLEATPKYLERFPNIADKKRKTFCAMLSAVDDAVGKVMAKLRDAGLEKNTLVIFLSDNGGPTASTTSSNGPLRGFKMTTNEGGTRVPFMMQWPDQLPAGKTYDQPVMNLDVLPTLVVAGGGKVDPAWKLDGVDIMPFLKEPTKPTAHTVMYWKYGPQWAIIEGEWKLVVSRVDGDKPRLIHLSADLSEANDRLTSDPDKVTELTAKWKAWDKEQKPALWGKGSAEEGTEAKPKKAAKKAAKKGAAAPAE
jgi:arylsulfatase A-like enzyme